MVSSMSNKPSTAPGTFYGDDIVQRRRSATICIFSPDDEEMMNAKTGNWFIDNKQRGRSNNSALLIRDEVTREQFHRLMESTKQQGEPGFIFASDTEHLFNPLKLAA